MIKASYEQLIEKIASQSGLTKEEIKKRIEAKKAKLSGLISNEGAAQIVAAELGITFGGKIKINEIMHGLRNVSIDAKILKIFPIRTYIKGGKEQKVANLLVGDETGSTRVVLWDTNHIKLIEENKLKEGDSIKIENASIRGTINPEVHLTNLSKIEKLEKDIKAVEKEILNILRIEELQKNVRCILKAAIVQTFEPRTFFVCPECNMKVIEESNRFVCQKHGNVIPKKREIMGMILDDGSATIRAICFDETIEKLGESLGKDFWLEGRTRENKLFGNLEFVVSNAREVNVEEII